MRSEQDGWLLGVTGCWAPAQAPSGWQGAKVCIYRVRVETKGRVGFHANVCAVPLVCGAFECVVLAGAQALGARHVVQIQVVAGFCACAAQQRPQPS